MKNNYRTFLIFMTIVFSTIMVSGQEININIGFRDSIKSEILNESRTILIHLPESYSSEKSYPVVYRLDGDIELLAETVIAANRLTYADEVAPEMIIVAIENTNRPRDMWPTNTMYYPETYQAGARFFLEFIEKELIPYIEKKYRSTERMLCGQSLSGVFTLYAFLTKPKLFDSYLVSSGAFPDCKEFFTELYNKSFSQIDKFNGQEIFITNGLQDPLDPGGIFQKEIADFSNTIKDKLGNKVRHKYLIYENEGHVPFHSIYDGLKYFFESK